VEDERERTKGAQDEQVVEAHRTKGMSDEPDDSSDAERRETDDESDVEAHRFKG
jgi:hypothetical protein